MDAFVNRVVKGYQFIERIGAGGFGTVYRATQPAVGREVAIKVIAPDQASQPSFIRRFEIEAQMVARLEHPHIVPLYDYWRDPSGAYLVMRLLRGSLRAALRNGPWSEMSTAQLVDQIAGALTIAHRNGVIHRDIKPDNILLDEDNNAYLTDFGIATAIGMADEITAAGMTVGSAAYITPEQIRSEPVSPQTDIYSLGLVIYETLTGERPFNKATTPDELAACHLAEPLPPVHEIRRGLPAALNAIIQTATAKLPEHRYGDALRLAAAFRAAIPSPDHQPRHQPLADPLTERELEILGLLREGLSNGEIAARLVLSLTTVKWYLRQIFSKLDVHDRARAVERAGQLGLFGATLSVGAGGELASTILARPTAPPSGEEPALTQAVENPYKGLRAYQEADVADFFGREALTAQLVARLAETGSTARFLAVVGPSGSGKSSVVRAGLIPALRRGALPDSARWFLADMLPGNHPLEELEAALLRIAVNPPESLLGQLREDERGLTRALKRVLPADNTLLVLIIDQFEEVFTLVSDEAERLHFLNSLHAAVTDPRGRLRVVVTLRADFYDRPLLYERFGALVQARTEVVLPLSTDELTQAIVRPAARVGVTVVADLLAALLKDVGEQPGTLPLLQYTLTELFERRVHNHLTVDAYRAGVGLFGTLARRADELYEALEPTAQEAARQMFLRLVTLGEGVEDTRRRVPTAELVAPADAERALDEVLDTFGQYRLLSFDRDPLTRVPTVEVAHEALIRHWGRLRSWLNDSREDLYVQRRLMVAASEWARSGREVSYLARGARLAQFEALATAATIALNPEESAYLTASAAERQRQEITEREQRSRELTLQRRAANRLRYLVGGLVAFLSVTVVLSALALNRGDQLAVSLTNSDAVRLALESLRMQAYNDSLNPLIALLAVRSVRMTYTPQGDQALVNAAQKDYPLARLTLDEDYVGAFDVAFSPDGTTLAVHFAKNFSLARSDAQVWLWDAHTFQKLRPLEGAPFGGIVFPMWTQDSKYVLAQVFEEVNAGVAVTIYLWETSTGRVVQRFSPSADTLSETYTAYAYAVSPDENELYEVIADAKGKFAIHYWDMQTGADIRRVELPFSDPSKTSIWLSRATDRNAQELAFISTDGEAPQLWDLRQREKIHDMEGITVRSEGAVFSPSLRYVAMTIPEKSTTDREFSVRVWDVNTGQIVSTFSGLKNGISLLPFNLDFSHNDRYLVAGNTSNENIVRLWDMATGKLLHQWKFEGASVKFSPDSRVLAISHHWGSSAIIFSLQDANLPQSLPHPGRVRMVDVSHNGKLIATAGGDGVARLWNAQTFALERQLALPQLSGSPVTGVIFSPDDRYLVTASRATNGYSVWDVHNGQQVWHSEGQAISRWAVAISSDGKWMLATDSNEQLDPVEIQVVEVGTGKIAARLTLPNGVNGPACAPFSPDDKFMIIMSEGALPKALLWEWRSNNPPLEIVNTEQVPSRCGAFTPDGKYVFLGGDDGIGRLHEVATGTEVRRFLGHAGVVFLAVAMSPDGRHVLTTADDRTARIWELATGKEVRRFIFDGGIWGAAYYPDGSAIVIGGYDGNAAYVLRADLKAEIKALCARLTRDFTDAEREQYGIPDHNPTCP